MRFELTTSTLARLRSTPELRPRLINLPPEHPNGGIRNAHCNQSLRRWKASDKILNSLLIACSQTVLPTTCILL